MNDRLFPEYLNKGSKGPAVALLQTLLLSQDFNRNIVVDGDYGGETARGVEELQQFLNGVANREVLEVDGNFGSETRKAYAKYFHLDVDTLPASIFAGETVGVGP